MYQKKNQIVGVEASPTRVYPKFNSPTKVREPQTTFSRSLARSSTGYGKTFISYNNKKDITKESPIMKVTTTKQMFYPSYQNETEEILEIQENQQNQIQTIYSKPLYSEVRNFYSPTKPTAYARKFDTLDNYHDAINSKNNELRSKSLWREKQHGRNYKTTYVPQTKVYEEPILTYPTTTLVPMYTETPLYGSKMYYPVTSTYKYTPSTYYKRIGGGKHLNIFNKLYILIT